MRTVVQRVTTASVAVDGGEIAHIGPGLLVLAGFGHGDDLECVAAMARRIAALRIFADADGRFRHSALDTRGAVLAVPNFTLYGDTGRGRRPDFTAALAPDRARDLFEVFVQALRAAGIAKVAAGEFGAHMAVSLVNDGPVTLWIEDPA